MSHTSSPKSCNQLRHEQQTIVPVCVFILSNYLKITQFFQRAVLFMNLSSFKGKRVRTCRKIILLDKAGNIQSCKVSREQTFEVNSLFTIKHILRNQSYLTGQGEKLPAHFRNVNICVIFLVAQTKGEICWLPKWTEWISFLNFFHARYFRLSFSFCQCWNCSGDFSHSPTPPPLSFWLVFEKLYSKSCLLFGTWHSLHPLKEALQSWDLSIIRTLTKHSAEASYIRGLASQIFCLKRASTQLCSSANCTKARPLHIN